MKEMSGTQGIIQMLRISIKLYSKNMLSFNLLFFSQTKMPYPGEQYGVLDCTQLHQVVIPGKAPGLTPVNIPSAGLKKMKGNCVYRSLASALIMNISRFG